jgi:hypothetical protein
MAKTSRICIRYTRWFIPNLCTTIRSFKISTENLTVSIYSYGFHRNPFINLISYIIAVKEYREVTVLLNVLVVKLKSSLKAV